MNSMLPRLTFLLTSGTLEEDRERECIFSYRNLASELECGRANSTSEAAAGQLPSANWSEVSP